MATLTEDQKKRIEENKKRALAIRAAKFSNNPSNTFSNTNQVSPAPASLPKPNIPANYQKKEINTAINQKTENTLNNNHFSNKCGNNVLPIIKQNYSDNKRSWSQFQTNNSFSETSQAVTVHLSLISKDRFVVEFPFDKTIVELLKTVPGKLYDPKKSQWHFPLREYNKIKTTLQNCKAIRIVIKSLPNYIVKIFIQHPKVKTDYKTINLSIIEESLLRNLYPFQKEGVQFGISKNGRCIIADDMGLGKTIQAIGISHYYYRDWPLLVVCPSSMRYQWEEEIRNNLPKIPVTKIFVMSNSKEQIHNPLVLITSYDLMARCETNLLALKFGIIIMDESHSLKNLKTNRTKVALSLISKANRCILLSGTPALSRPVELYPQIKAIEPNAFSLKEFGTRYCDGKEGPFGWDYSGSSNMEELKILLEERFMIRRLKSTVLTQLPMKIRQVVVLDKEIVKPQTKAMSAFAEKLNDETVKGITKRGTLLSYFAETAKTKIKAIKEYLSQILETGNKFLVFAHHKEMLDAICELLENKKTFYIRIDGSVNSEERKSICDQFQFEDKFRVAVLSITAASTGLTLTAANLVVFAELFWNPGILTQAEDRVHRIGQQDCVLVQYLIARDTADDHLWPLIKSKLDILNQAGLSKDNFNCERTTVKTTNNQKTMDNYFDEIQDYDDDLNHFLDEVEGEVETKRAKLNE